jgi:hypothetical protein
MVVINPSALWCCLAGKIVSWLKSPGDKVKKGESIVVSAARAESTPPFAASGPPPSAVVLCC